MNRLAVGASTAEERLRLKRLRQRTYVKEAYDRQKLMMTSLRAQAASLEDQFTQLLRLSTTSPASDASTCSPASEQLLEQYRELTQIRSSLVVGNEALNEAYARVVKLSQSLQSIHEKNCVPSPFYFQTLSVAEYELVIARVRAEAYTSMSEPEKSSVRSELGWRITREIDGQRCQLKFWMKKSYKTFPAHELLTRSWAILSSPTKYTQLYSPSVRAELHLLQHVDDDTLLYYTELESAAEATKVIRSVYLLRRERFATGHLILVCSVDPIRLDFNDQFGINHIIEDVRSQARAGDRVHGTGTIPAPRWAKICAWMAFEDQSLGETSFTWGGSSDLAWASEVQMIAMRWQILVVGYDALLQPGFAKWLSK